MGRCKRDARAGRARVLNEAMVQPDRTDGATPPGRGGNIGYREGRGMESACQRVQPMEKRERTLLATTTRRRRVLLIDDEPDLAEGLAEILRLDGHEVEVARDGPSALELARRLRPELVVCDLGLPGMDGYEVAARLRASPETAACHLLALSGYGDHDALRRTQEAGFDRHLTKPVGSRELREILAAESEPPRGASRPDPDPLDGL